MTSNQIEWEYIQESDLSYLKQPDEVYNIKHSDYYIYHTDGTNHYRRIFYKCEYSEFEKKHQKALQEEIERLNIQLPADWDDAQTLKYCYSGGFVLQKSIEALRLHLDWRQNPIMQKMNKQALQVLEEGIFYHLGRDKQFRPIIVLNMWMVNPKKVPVDIYLSAICNLLVKVANVEFIKGHVESWVVILETKEKGITDLEINTITRIVQVMAKNFTSTLEKMFIMNPSFLFKGAWKLIKNIIHPETSAKINMLSKKEFVKLQQFIEPDQLEEKYGGTIPNKTCYWPPDNTLKETQQNYLNVGENTNANHLHEKNDSQLFFEKSNGSPSRDQSHQYNNRNGEYHEIDGISKPIQTTQNSSCCKCNIF